MLEIHHLGWTLGDVLSSGRCVFWAYHQLCREKERMKQLHGLAVTLPSAPTKQSMQVFYSYAFSVLVIAYDSISIIIIIKQSIDKS